MNNLYGDLPSLKMDIDKGGWSKPGSVPPPPPPSPFAKAASLLPVKLITPSRPPAASYSTEGSLSTVADASITTAASKNSFKPRQAFIPSSLKANPVQPSRGLGIASTPTVTTIVSASSNSNSSISSENVKIENQDKDKKNSDHYQSNINQSSSSTTITTTTTSASNNKIETVKNYSLSTADESNLPGAGFDVVDAYDPYKPNDYLTYCQERLEAKRIKKLEEANEKKSLELEKVRLEKEKERAEAIETGDFQKLQSTISSGGRGRGGISNLPAWMTTSGTQASSTTIAPGLGTSSSSSSYGLGMGLGHNSYGNRYDDDDTGDDEEKNNNIYGPSVAPSSYSHENKRSNNNNDDGGDRNRYNDTDSFGRSTQKQPQPQSSSSQVKSNKPWLANSKYANDSNSDHDDDDGGDKRGRSNSIGYSSNSNQKSYSKDHTRDSKKYKTDTTSSLSITTNRPTATTTTTSAAVLMPTCIILLKNMIAPSDIDDSLTDEVKNECEKYGPVESCLLHVVSSSSSTTTTAVIPEEEQVRLFVEFIRQDSAVRAYKEMNGRYFGGRRITAEFYDEMKFACRDLAPAGSG